MPDYAVHTRSMRLASGAEVLVTSVQTKGGRVGYGISFNLDATESRHMAEWSAGLRKDPPETAAQR